MSEDLVYSLALLCLLVSALSFLLAFINVVLPIRIRGTKSRRRSLWGLYSGVFFVVVFVVSLVTFEEFEARREAVATREARATRAAGVEATREACLKGEKGSRCNDVIATATRQALATLEAKSTREARVNATRDAREEATREAQAKATREEMHMATREACLNGGQGDYCIEVIATATSQAEATSEARVEATQEARAESTRRAVATSEACLRGSQSTYCRKVIATATHEAWVRPCDSAGVSPDYRDLYRRIEEFENKRFLFRGEVVQVVIDDEFNHYRINITPSEYGFWSDDVYVAVDEDTVGLNTRILEEDVIQFCGFPWKLLRYETIMGGQREVPAIYMVKFILLEN